MNNNNFRATDPSLLLLVFTFHRVFLPSCIFTHMRLATSCFLFSILFFPLGVVENISTTGRTVSTLLTKTSSLYFSSLVSILLALDEEERKRCHGWHIFLPFSHRRRRKKTSERSFLGTWWASTSHPKRSSMQQKSIASSVTISFANETPSFVSLAGEEESSFFFSFRLPI